MTKQQHVEALNCLKHINNFQVKSTTKLTNKDIIRTEYRHQIIELGDYNLILSGTLEQIKTKSKNTDRIYLVISLYDSLNQELKFNAKQFEEFKTVLKQKMFA